MSYKIVLKSGFSEYSVDLEFKFSIVKNIESGRKRDLTTIANQSPEAARHFAFQPGEQNPRVEFTLYNDGTDKSNGSLSSSNITDSRFSNDTVETIEEQIIWLDEYVTDNTSDPRWRFFGGRWSDRNGDGTDEGTNVVVQKVNLPRVAGVTRVNGTIDLKLGVTI
jgi:hypothetical protein